MRKFIIQSGRNFQTVFRGGQGKALRYSLEGGIGRLVRRSELI